VARRRQTATERLRQLLEVLKTEPPGDLRPPLEGFVYRFTVYLPLLSKGRPVFTPEHCRLLADLFHARFEGYSATSVEGSPPWYGSWLPPGAEEPVIDKHMLFVIYTPQLDETKQFFRYLKSVLQERQIANQEVVLVEHVSVSLMDSAPPPRHP
jgi:hypothetical protein